MAACDLVELEIKVSALPGETLLKEVVLSLAHERLGLLGEVQSLVLEAHYHDDSQGLLRSLGWALRARLEGDLIIATAKGPAQDQNGVPARPEINAPIRSLPAAGDPLPAPLTGALKKAGLSINRWPGSQWTTKVLRTFSDVRLPKGGRAELAIDHGSVQSGSRTHPIAELELELRDGKPGELLDAAAIVSKGLSVRPGGRSKAARGLQLLGRLSLPKTSPKNSVLGLWEQTCELEEWIREGHKEAHVLYLKSADSLFGRLAMDRPSYLDSNFERLQVALDSKEHAQLLWRIFTATHQQVN